MMLKGKKGIIFGVANEHSLAWHIAVEAVAQGAEVLLSVASERFVRRGADDDVAEAARPGKGRLPRRASRRRHLATRAEAASTPGLARRRSSPWRFPA